MPSPRSTRWVASVAIVGLVAAGCGSDDDANEDADPATTEAVPATTVEAGGESSAGTTGDADRWEATPVTTEPMSEEDAAAVDEALEAIMSETEGQLPAMWIGVWDPEKGMHLTASGEATLPDTAATSEDNFRIGSITKTVTAAAVLAEVDEGDLALDDTVADILPDLADAHPEVADITVEQLLAMTSGIPDYANLPLILPQVAEDPARVWTADEIIEQVLTQEELAPPGTGGYSTTNYLILGEMLEELNGASAEDQLTAMAEAAGAAGMGFTPDDDETLPEPGSSGYVFDGGVASLEQLGITVESGTDVSDWSTTWGRAGGGMYSTLEALGAWAASGFGTNQLSAELGDYRLSQTSELAEGPTYGLGIESYPDGWIGHDGQVVGWIAHALYNPETGTVLVGAVNETESGLAIDAVFTTLYPDLQEWLL
jgi:D-alanyl-D-alanine carboxypeptidase